jgi:hypothetical protein|tara:strand:- start:1323 stop:1496 length:174 start_codon:yes stop_codon:yes gene_type:complete
MKKEYSIWTSPKSEWNKDLLSGIKLPEILSDEEIDKINQSVIKHNRKITRIPNILID